MGFDINWEEIVVGAIAGPLQTVTTVKVGEVLEKVYKKDPEAHKATIKALYIGIEQLLRVVEKTKTKIDDSVVKAFSNAIIASAELHDIDLDGDDEDGSDGNAGQPTDLLS